MAKDKDAIEARIAQLEQTYAQTEERIGQLTGKAQDAAIRYLADCGNEINRLKAQL